MTAPSTKAPSTWYCSLCLEHHNDQPPFLINNDEVCKQTLLHIFEDSIKSEVNYPPRWGSTVIDPWDSKYRRVVDTHFLKRYDAKSREYSVPERLRVYCRRRRPNNTSPPCDTFLGRRQEGKIGCLRCEKCQEYTCPHCLMSFSPGKRDWKFKKIGHYCRPDPFVEKQDLEQAFAGLKRGRDFQYCPNAQCQKRIELAEACNHIKCPCGTEFCYICGKPAEPGTGHWAPGGCVQYGTAENGLHDESTTDEDEDDDEETDVEGEIRLQLEMMYRSEHGGGLQSRQR